MTQVRQAEAIKTVEKKQAPFVSFSYWVPSLLSLAVTETHWMPPLVPLAVTEREFTCYSLNAHLELTHWKFWLCVSHLWIKNDVINYYLASGSELT